MIWIWNIQRAKGFKVAVTSNAIFERAALGLVQTRIAHDRAFPLNLQADGRVAAHIGVLRSQLDAVR